MARNTYDAIKNLFSMISPVSGILGNTRGDSTNQIKFAIDVPSLEFRTPHSNVNNFKYLHLCVKKMKFETRNIEISILKLDFSLILGGFKALKFLTSFFFFFLWVIDLGYFWRQIGY